MPGLVLGHWDAGWIGAGALGRDSLWDPGHSAKDVLSAFPTCTPNFLQISKEHQFKFLPHCVPGAPFKPLTGWLRGLRTHYCRVAVTGALSCFSAFAATRPRVLT